mmetsp:Transcript_72152/g.192462  ORF Transcript_72152/g.192462 Transcript_72152/m.192462 type:complete len:202 (-) Transcript_72152:124-729(-)
MARLVRVVVRGTLRANQGEGPPVLALRGPSAEPSKVSQRCKHHHVGDSESVCISVWKPQHAESVQRRRDKWHRQDIHRSKGAEQAHRRDGRIHANISAATTQIVPVYHPGIRHRLILALVTNRSLRSEYRRSHCFQSSRMQPDLHADDCFWQENVLPRKTTSETQCESQISQAPQTQGGKTRFVAAALPTGARLADCGESS